MTARSSMTARLHELVNRYEFSDVDVAGHVPEGGNSGLYLMGLAVQLLDSTGKTDLTFGDCADLRGLRQGCVARARRCSAPFADQGNGTD